MISKFDQVQSIDVRSRWMRANIDIVADSRRNIFRPIELRPNQYQTSMVINSLDKNRDEGEYTCSTEVTIHRVQNDTILTNATARTIFIASEFFYYYIKIIISNCTA